MLRNHIGKSAALNSTTMLLATFSGFVSSRIGISGADATRVSITANRPSSKKPMMIGTSAEALLQPERPASTTP